MTDPADATQTKAFRIAEREVGHTTGMSTGLVVDMVDAAVQSLVFPPLMPFAIALAVVGVPMNWLSDRAEAAERTMPDAWYPAVWSEATRDGRFHVGRLLAAKGHVTTAEAGRFLVIEKAAGSRDDDRAPAVAPNDARDALTGFYESKRTILDKAVTLVSGATVDAARATFSGATSVLGAAARKIRVGF